MSEQLSAHCQSAGKLNIAAGELRSSMTDRFPDNDLDKNDDTKSRQWYCKDRQNSTMEKAQGASQIFCETCLTSVGICRSFWSTSAIILDQSNVPLPRYGQKHCFTAFATRFTAFAVVFWTLGGYTASIRRIVAKIQVKTLLRRLWNRFYGFFVTFWALWW